MKTNQFFRYTLLLLSCLFAAFFGITGCRNPNAGKAKSTALCFSLAVDPNVYSQTRFKKPPQFAVWIEDSKGKEIHTVWVTDKTGAGSWGGKTTRPVSLPYWVSRWNIETGSDTFPTPANHVVDGLTGATPKQDLACRIEVPAGSTWNCYVEVNASGDFNQTFAEELKDGTRDRNGNGQPSVIFRGTIKATHGRKCTPLLVGRTDQLESVNHIITDTQGITTAGNLFSKIEVVCE